MLVAFSDRQLKLVHRAAAVLHEQQRPEFIRSIERHLAGQELINDLAVRNAALFMLSCFGVAARPSVLHDKAGKVRAAPS